MADTPIKSVWMWRDETDGAIWGLMLDEEAQRVEWTDSVGCACGDSFGVQTFTDFLEKGPRYASPPPDVVEEATDSIRQLIARQLPDQQPTYTEYWT